MKGCTMDDYKLKFTKFNLTLEICTENKRFGKCVSKNEYKYNNLNDLCEFLRNISIVEIEPTMNDMGDLESIELKLVDSEQFEFEMLSNINHDESLQTDAEKHDTEKFNREPIYNDDEKINTGQVSSKITVTDEKPRFESNDGYIPSYRKFPTTVHYKRALLMMLGHNLEDIEDKTGGSPAMIRRGMNWFKTYGLIYAWDERTGNVIITQKGADLLKMEGLIVDCDGKKILLASVNDGGMNSNTTVGKILVGRD